MLELTSLLKSKHALLIFLAVTSIYGWSIGFWWKYTIKKYNLLTIVVIEIIITFFILVVLVVLAQKHSELYREFSKITLKDYGYITLIGFSGLVITYLGTSLLLHHNIEDIRLTDFVISILINTIAIYLFTSKKITIEILLGLGFVTIGGYLLIK